LQPDFALSVVHAFVQQQRRDPAQSATIFGTSSITMVNIVKGQGCGAVDGQISLTGFVFQAPHGQHQKIGGIRKRMLARA
jgi:hypothetical protein